MIKKSLMRVLLLLLSTTAMADEHFDKELRPFLKTYCYRCHGAEKQKGDINLETFNNRMEMLKEHEMWREAYLLVHEGEMPSKGDQPSAEEKEHFIKTVKEMLAMDWGKIKRPGHVTLSRLSNIEYDNSVRDLTGFDIKPARKFAKDITGNSGFNNDHDALFVSGSQMEKYFAAADFILDEINDIERHKNDAPLYKKIEAEKMLITDEITKAKDWGYLIGREQDTLYTAINFPRDGFYEFSFRAGGNNRPYLKFRINEELIENVTITADQEKRETYKVRCWVRRGLHQIRVNLGKRPKTAEEKKVAAAAKKAKAAAKKNKGKKGKAKKTKKNLQAPAQAKKPTKKPAKKKKAVRDDSGFRLAFDWFSVREQKQTQFISPIYKTAELQKRDAKTLLTRFASRAFRRPLRAGELDYLMKLYKQNDKQDFLEKLRLPMKAVLISPHFLYHQEQQPSKGKSRKLNDFELASRLSYFLWMSMPDDALYQLAMKGELSKPGVLQAELKRMIRDPKSKAMTNNFSSQWLGIQELGISAVPDSSVFPQFTASLQQAMLKETQFFFDDLVRSDKGLNTLIDSDYTYLNEELARHYGIKTVSGSQFRKVALKDKNRGGLLGMGSVLTVSSTPIRTSPVIRGMWVLERLLGREMLPPPPDAGEIAADAGNDPKGKSLREILAAHRDNPSCASCHKKIDPMGFGLENFDAIGRFTAKRAGKKIDNLGELPDGTEFRGAAQLKHVLKEQFMDEFSRNMVKQMLSFSLGRSLEFYDEFAIRKIHTAFKKSGYKPSVLISEVATSLPFNNIDNHIEEKAQ